MAGFRPANMGVAEVCRRRGISLTTFGNRRRRFMDAGKRELAGIGGNGRSDPAEALAGENESPRIVVGEQAIAGPTSSPGSGKEQQAGGRGPMTMAAIGAKTLPKMTPKSFSIRGAQIMRQVRQDHGVRVRRCPRPGRGDRRRRQREDQVPSVRSGQQGSAHVQVRPSTVVPRDDRQDRRMRLEGLAAPRPRARRADPVKCEVFDGADTIGWPQCARRGRLRLRFPRIRGWMDAGMRGGEARCTRALPQAHGRPRDPRHSGGAQEGAARRPQGREKGERRAAERIARTAAADVVVVVAAGRGRRGDACAAHPVRQARAAILIPRNTMRGAMAKPPACRLCGREFDPPRRSGSRVYCKRCTAKADREIAKTLSVDCKECGKAFPARTRAARYCSVECRSAAARRANAESQRRYRADPQSNARNLALARASAARRAAERGEKPPRESRGAKSLKPNATPAEPYPCALCGRRFAPYGGRRPIHCKRCSARVDKEIARKRTLNCKECGKKFTTLNRIVRYCSRECNAAGRRRITDEIRRRRMADPEFRAMDAARQRARTAARRAKE